MKKKYLYLVLITAIVVILDQITKMYIHLNFRLGESLPVIQDVFHITYVRNTGAAFGLFSTSSELFRSAFFLSLPPIAMIVIFMLLRSTPDHEKLQSTALSLVFGGALGNYIDRLRFRYVIDFLDFHYKSVWSYPAFNVADIAIVCGVAILFFFMFREEWKAKKVKA